MKMKQIFNEAQERLAALPKWVKVMMWVQTMLCGIMFAFLGGVLVAQKEQLIAFHNVAVTLLQRTPDSAVQADLRHAIEIGVASLPYLRGLIAVIAASAAAGSVVVCLTPMKAKKQ